MTEKIFLANFSVFICLVMLLLKVRWGGHSATSLGPQPLLFWSIRFLFAGFKGQVRWPFGPQTVLIWFGLSRFVFFSFLEEILLSPWRRACLFIFQCLPLFFLRFFSHSLSLFSSLSHSLCVFLSISLSIFPRIFYVSSFLIVRLVSFFVSRKKRAQIIWLDILFINIFCFGVSCLVLSFKSISLGGGFLFS